MEYDYRVTEVAEDIVEVFDSLNGKQLKRISDLLIQMKQEEEQERKERRMKWMKETLELILQEYAERTCSYLEIEEQDTELFVTLKNDVGFILTEDRELRTAVMMADYVVMGAEEGCSQMFLTYSY